MDREKNKIFTHIPLINLVSRSWFDIM